MTTFKKIIIVLFLLINHAQAQVASALIPSPPELSASSYLLIDANSGKIIIEHNPDKRLPPASLTKIMTSYIAANEIDRQAIEADDFASISVKAWKMGGSKMFVREGTKVSVEDLLRGVIIQSGNDASIALAEHIAGDEDSFVEMMNQQATLLGMKNTKFQNSTGWPTKDHYTSSRDLSTLAVRLIMDFPEHYKFYSEKEFTYNNIKQRNRNKLLFSDKSVDGLKTGHTNDAGYCLVASAKRNGMRLVSVVMGSKSERARLQESQKLLSYGFRYFETHQFYGLGQVINSPKLWAGQNKSLDLILDQPVILTLPRGKKDSLDFIIEVDKDIIAPVFGGQPYGTLKIFSEGGLIDERQLLASKDIDVAPFFARIWDLLILFFKGLLNISSA